VPLPCGIQELLGRVKKLRDLLWPGSTPKDGGHPCRLRGEFLIRLEPEEIVKTPPRSGESAINLLALAGESYQVILSSMLQIPLPQLASGCCFINRKGHWRGRQNCRAVCEVTHQNCAVIRNRRPFHATLEDRAMERVVRFRKNSPQWSAER
jgi:hypothetical protein